MKHYLFYGALILLVLIGFIFFVPKVTTRVVPATRKKMLDDFIQDTKKNRFINPRKFWMLREYYSPGSFTFKKEGFKKNESNEFIKKYPLSLNKNIYFFPFLTFQSDKFISLEALTKTSSIAALLQPFPEKNKNCIIKQKSAYLCYRNANTLELVFIKSMSEMMITNGFYDYKDKPIADLTVGKYWLVISEITL